MNLKLLRLKMDYGGFWRFVTARKKELEALTLQMPLALGDCVNLAKFVLEVISEVIEELPSENHEKAIVLFKPVSFLPVFSLRFNLISSFKDQFLHSSHYDMRRSAEEDDETVQNNANRCIGVAPWILS
ncbi:hypothetical protein C1H46_009847 [Malus baccata]|uniref:FRIGIDA-like protein n=1 Tax=Malus baccata TaxID=106549 RepID=A0A540N1Y8_MALBA|nr:hypothetical protein C1H46_009847 [Malus baccata]